MHCLESDYKDDLSLKKLIENKAKKYYDLSI